MGKKGIVIGAVVAALIVISLVIGGIIAAVLLISPSGESGGGTDEDRAKDVVKDFITAFKENDRDIMEDLLMDESGSFLKDSDPDSLDEILDEMMDEPFEGKLEWKIENVEKTDWTTENTSIIYMVTYTIKMEDPETREMNSFTDTMMVARNVESGKFGLCLEGFDIDLQPDGFEPDDGSGSATEISPGKSEHHNIHAPDDEDWFVFTLDSTSEVKVWTYGKYGGDTELFIYDDEENLLFENDDRDRDAFSEVQEELEAGTYFVKVTGYDTDETVMEYTLEMEFV